MQATELKMHLSEQDYVPVILSYADANHYLAGGVDGEGNYHLIENNEGQTEAFNSMREAEVCLAALGAKNAIFEMESAYDEMVGSERGARTRMMLTFEHVN